MGPLYVGSLARDTGLQNDVMFKEAGVSQIWEAGCFVGGSSVGWEESGSWEVSSFAGGKFVHWEESQVWEAGCFVGGSSVGWEVGFWECGHTGSQNGGYV